MRTRTFSVTYSGDRCSDQSAQGARVSQHDQKKNPKTLKVIIYWPHQCDQITPCNQIKESQVSKLRNIACLVLLEKNITQKILLQFY